VVLKLLFWVLTALQIVLLLGALIVAPFSLMAFDAPGSTESPLVRRWFFALIALPVVTFLSLVGGMVTYFAMKRDGLALTIATLPFIYLLLLGLWFFFGQGSTSATPD